MGFFLSKSLQLYPMGVTKSWKLLNRFMDSSDKGKNLHNNMYDCTHLKERFLFGFVLKKLTEFMLVGYQNYLQY